MYQRNGINGVSMAYQNAKRKVKSRRKKGIKISKSEEAKMAGVFSNERKEIAGERAWRKRVANEKPASNNGMSMANTMASASISANINEMAHQCQRNAMANVAIMKS
jgi:hypothetical protein